MRKPKKVVDRIPATIRRYAAIAEDQKPRDVAEADTVTLVKDIMSDYFGSDKYQEQPANNRYEALIVTSPLRWTALKLQSAENSESYSQELRSA